MDKGIEEEIILKEVLRIRSDHQRIGTRKLYEMHTPLLIQHQAKLGRDKLFDPDSYRGEEEISELPIVRSGGNDLS